MEPRQFAIQVVKQLHEAGFQALWAGGCVRDQLMGLLPKDYDVATNALPEQVRQLFGKKRTLAIGASFGVIVVLGGSAGQIEVATFRQDLGYSDGRHPDQVVFSDARQDALRRDFTINGMFYDPLADQVLDYVDGRRDIDERLIRAIGDPAARIAEDKLRMLRGIRFAATFRFEIETATWQAITAHADQIRVVSRERIGAEMRRILQLPNRHQAAQWLADSKLLSVILEQGERLTHNRANWKTRIRWLERLGAASFETAAAILLSPLLKLSGIDPIAEAWRLTNQEQRSIVWQDEHWLVLTRAKYLPWSQLQPLLTHPEVRGALQIAETAVGPDHPSLVFCRERLSWTPDRLDPPALLDGGDLLKLGIPRGPIYAELIQGARDAQLDGTLNSRSDAVEWAKNQTRSSPDDPAMPKKIAPENSGAIDDESNS